MFDPRPDGPAEKNGPQASKTNTWHQRFAEFPRWIRIAGFAAGVLLAAVLALAGTFYIRCSRQIDRELQAGVFADSVNIYGAPLYLSVGDPLSMDDATEALDIAGYHRSASGDALSWRRHDNRVEIFPERSATAELQFGSGKITRIVRGGKDVREISLASPVITSLSSKKEERLLVSFGDIPDILVKAVLSAEDKRFFRHDGLDLPRIIKAAYADIKDGRKEQGASTITMQLVRGLWLNRDKRWLRKFSEAMMTIHLEHKWSKQKIFETYANQVYLGRQGDYSVHGFAEGARVFFGKRLADISLPEAALLAGVVQRPSYFNPFRSPDRAKERRDLVLALMRNNHYIGEEQYASATEEPVRLVPAPLNETRAPWFLDLVDERLQARQAANWRNGDEPIRQAYSTIDLNLQHAAEEAVKTGMQQVDQLLAKRNGKAGPKAEAALIALDPHTGEIRAIVGGRDYRKSQLDRVLASRPPGSVFKPFVYAAALNTAISGSSDVFTPASMIDDSPTTFWFNGKAYEPANFRGASYGTMTLQDALARSDNIAAVKLAEEIGYGSVVEMARRFGLNAEIRATPAVALGAYDVTPLEIAEAYTAFANGGVAVKPALIAGYRDAAGERLSGGADEARQVLDPRINWLMVNMLEEVLRSGTAAGVRARGFTLPAAGKTGTSHDGWFAGFTTKLLCVVWVGFDDYRDLGLEGARSALPIWTDFMKRASRMGAYRNAKEFAMPSGITEARICLQSGKLAGDLCTETREEYFVSGTEPAEMCNLHANAATVATNSGDSAGHAAQSLAAAQP